MDTKYSCIKCNYYTNIKHHYENHCNSKKHCNENDSLYIFECNSCKNKYKSETGLRKHKKLCIVVKEEPRNIVIDETAICNFIETNKEKFLKILVNIPDMENQLVLYKKNNELIKYDEANIRNEVIEIKQEMKQEIKKVDKRIDKLEEKLNFYIKNYCKDNMNYATFIENIPITYDFCKEFTLEPCEPIFNLLKKELEKCGLENSPIYCMIIKDFIAIRLKNNNEWESYEYNDMVISVIKEIIEPLIEKIKNGLMNNSTEDQKRKNSYKQHIGCLDKINTQKDILDNGLYEPARIDNKKINKLIEKKGVLMNEETNI
jgi:hypothetical protein